VLEVEANFAIDGPVGTCRLRGRGCDLILDLPREAPLSALWSAGGGLRGVSRPLSRALTRWKLELLVAWRGHVIARLGRSPFPWPAWLPLRPAPLGLVQALLRPRPSA
jgi:hypothetical protein